MDRKSKQIEIFGEKCYLFERSAEDVMSMLSFVQKNNTNKIDILIYQSSRILESSLRYNLKILKWYQIVKWIRYKIKFNFKYLIKNLSHTNIFDYCNIILELDGFADNKSKANKKKISK